MTLTSRASLARFEQRQRRLRLPPQRQARAVDARRGCAGAEPRGVARQRPTRGGQHRDADLGFGHIVASEIEGPNMFVNLV